MSDPVSNWNAFLILSGQLFVAAMLIPIITALIFRKEWNKPLEVFFWFLVVGLIGNLLELGFIWATKIENYYHVFEDWLKEWEIYNTNFLSIIFYLKDFLLLGLFYSLIIPVKKLSRIIFWSGLIIALAALLNYCFIEGFREFGVINPGADAIFIALLPLLYLWLSQKQSLRIPLSKNPYLWISLGLLIPNLLSLFLYFTGNYVQKNDFILYAKFFVAKNAFEIIGLIFIAIAYAYARYVRFIDIPGEEDATNIGS